MLTMWDLAPFAHIVFVSKPLALATLAQAAASTAASAGPGGLPHGGAGGAARGVLPATVAAGSAAAATGETSPEAALAAVEAAADAALHRALASLTEDQYAAHAAGLQRQVLVMPWGERGAFLSVRVRDGLASGAGSLRARAHVPAHPPSSGAVVDTLGAGDTFNAAFLFAAAGGHKGEIAAGYPGARCLGQLLTDSEPLPDSDATAATLLASAQSCAEAACFVAGEKIGQRGLHLPPAVRDYFTR